MKSRMVKAGLGALAGAAMLTAASAQGAEQWSMATALPGTFLEDGKRFAGYVEELTAGDIKITVFAPGTLGKSLKVTDTVKSGVAQAGHNWMGYDWGVDKATVVFANMAGGLNPEELMLWLWEGGGADLWFEYRMKEFGVASIPCGTFPTEIFLHARKPVRTLDDYKNIKQRTAGAWAEIGGELGASTVILPGTEVYPALERGVIDATEWGSPSVNLPVGFHKIAKYVIIPGVHQPGASQECQFNAAAWDKLSDRHKNLVKRAAKLNAFDTWSTYAYNDAAALKEMQADGAEVVRLEQSFIDAAVKQANDWADRQAAENPWFKRILEHRREFEARMQDWPDFRFPVGGKN